MRYLVSCLELRKWFDQIKAKSHLSWRELARSYEIAQRSLYEWRAGKSTIPHDFVEFVNEKYQINHPKAEILDDDWSRKAIAKKGGEMRMLIYGNPGTEKGRRLGGIRSMKTHGKLGKLSPFIPKSFVRPNLNIELAELVGVILGDGSITNRQIAITLHKTDDAEYAVYVSNLIKNLFKVKPTISERKSVLVIVLSRTLIVKFLTEIGLRTGNKVRNQVCVPDWVEKNELFTLACVRGLFDTDGCFYIDKHLIKDKVYMNCAMSFSNRSLPILAFFKRSLERMGYHPTQKTPYNIFLRREEEILRYVKDFGTSNSKISRRLKAYLKIKYGRVPKRS
ncbi:MAG: LAGLIDADG family homing endonuclease [bacterium]|nr:LAGLIDADG family homing endonuclease [bacterium]